MTDHIHATALLFLKDFTAPSADRYFIHNGESLREVSAQELVEAQGLIITHDYGLIASTLQSRSGELPKNVIDVIDFYKSACSLTQNDGSNSRVTIEELLQSPPSEFDATKYIEIFYRRSEFDQITYENAGAALLKLWTRLVTEAKENDELDRYMQVEAPIFNLIWSSMSHGIHIDRERLHAHKVAARDEFYLTLRDFSIDFSLPIEIPSRKTIERELGSRGFDITEGTRDYILDFLPMPDDFGSRLGALLRIHRSLNALNQLSATKAVAFPLADVAGTRTSRIILKAPSLQNIAKKHRNVIAAREGKQLYYVDYCQFEPGIMAAISNDAEIIKLFETGDLYSEVSKAVFGSDAFRKVSKQLFLSYSYGMSLKKVADAASAHGADRKTASEFFRLFSTFEAWKGQIIDQYQRSGKIGTAFGNYARRSAQGELSNKERRSCVSQVIQGTGSLIFKKSLIAMHKEHGIAPLIPMHDAILFEASDPRVADHAARTMERVFGEHFDGRLKGRAEISSFAE